MQGARTRTGSLTRKGYVRYEYSYGYLGPMLGVPRTSTITSRSTAVTFAGFSTTHVRERMLPLFPSVPV
eukprot:scaffold188891_cov24-Prasinocladus_malaysianus.AAC.1